MPKYKVLRPIEHDQKLYLPEMPDALPTVKSAGHGGDIPVDASGIIELSEQESRALVDGQIPLDESGGPLPMAASGDEPSQVPPQEKKPEKAERK